MNNKVYITSSFKEELEALNSGPLDYITVYKIENGKVYFKANNHRLHLDASEFKEVCLGQD
jgi:hypothetical protein